MSESEPLAVPEPSAPVENSVAATPGSSPAQCPPQLANDVVIVFNTQSAKIPKDKRTAEAADDALKFVLMELANAGFEFTTRIDRPGSLLIFVKATDAVVAITSYRSKVREWLFGVITAPPVAPTADSELDDSLTVAERLRLVFDRLTLPVEAHGLGITPGEGDWVFIESIFALHDPDFDVAWIKRWSRKWLLDNDELEILRNTFGEKIAFYFAFLQFYFRWLAVPAVIGVVAVYIAPPFAGWYAIVSGLWCLSFVEAWKHRENELAVQWGVKGISGLANARAKFKGESERENPITKAMEPYYPSWKRVVKQLGAIPTSLVAGVLLMLLQVIAFALEIFLSEIYDGPLKQYLVFVPTVLLATLVPTLSAIYNIIVTASTDWENHVSEDSYERSIIQKTFVLNFLTSFMGLFLSAYVYLPFGHLIAPNIDFITSTVQGVMGQLGDKALSHKEFSINVLRLRQQFIYFTGTAQGVNFFVETLLPYIQRRVFKEAKKLVAGAPVEIKDDEAEAPFLARVRGERDFPDYDVNEDYREMVVQFGYLSLFGIVWPMAPFADFINNWIELRGDAMKICLDTKRPIPARAESIGPWLDNLTFLTWLGSLTTASLVAMFGQSTSSSTNLVSTGPWMLLATMLLSEHGYLAARYLTAILFDAFDSTIIQKDQRQDYVNRQDTLKRSSGAEDLVEAYDYKASVQAEGKTALWHEAVSGAVTLLQTSRVKTEVEKKEE
ncbi:calcium-activated chloride channel-domain-containing protein [Limtongia smithiae]|uniref:calcium-activated chloride channel-domain-containing protein n=1 Tax=Limtongia smithiae TaxID=1125753 RepID=UPI0034CD56D5